MADTKWPTCKTAGVDCYGCGGRGSCKAAPGGNATYCFKDKKTHFAPGANGHATGNGRMNLNGTPVYEGAGRRRGETNGANGNGHAPKFFATADDAIAAAGRYVNGAGLTSVAVYRNADGSDAFHVARFELPDGDKEFRPVHPGKKGWKIGDPAGPLPLYRVHELPATGTVYVCEGEKAADAAWAIGLPAVTSAHGAASPDKSDWSPLAGRDVAILPDNDDPGRKYARAVAVILARLDPPARVRIVALPGLPVGGDVVEFVAAANDSAEPESIGTEVAAFADATAPVEVADLIGGPVLTCMADVEARSVDWLWRHRFPLGRLSLLVGAPGGGKSYLTCDMGAHVSTGTPWPDGSPCDRGTVLFVTAEDDPADTIRPRLDACGADPSQIHILTAVRRIDPETGKANDLTFTLTDVPALEAAMRRLRPSLVVIDPIGSFLGGGVDSHRDNEVRGVLAPVAQLAERYGSAVVVVCHRRKGNAGSADETAMGSRAFTGIARVAWHLSRDPDDKTRRLLLNGKNNLAPECDGLAFTIVGQPVGAVVWESDPVTMTADDALHAERKAEAGGDGDPAADDALTKLEQAQHFVADALRDGPRAWMPIAAAGRRAGQSPATLERARTRVAETFKAGVGGWFWRLRGDTRTEPVCEPSDRLHTPDTVGNAEVAEVAELPFLTPPGAMQESATAGKKPAGGPENELRQLRQLRQRKAKKQSPPPGSSPAPAAIAG